MISIHGSAEAASILRYTANFDQLPQHPLLNGDARITKMCDHHVGNFLMISQACSLGNPGASEFVLVSRRTI